MQEFNVDVAILGAGTAGLGAYHQASKTTDSLMLIESGPYGTTCARVGCMPSKLLIAAADAAHEARHAKMFGVHAADVTVDGREVLNRVRRERDRFVSFVVNSVEHIPDNQRLKGQARFLGPNSLQVDGHAVVHAQRIVIATGSRSYIPEMLLPAADRLLVNETLFELPQLPRSVAVFGAGAIGLELGQALSRLGVDVKVFGRSGAVAGIADDEIRVLAGQLFNEEFYLDPDAAVSAVVHAGAGVEVTYVHRTRGEITERFDYILAATGRRPNIDDIDLEKSGLTLDKRGMPDHDSQTMQCGNSHIFLAGDASAEIPLLHEASDEGHIAGINAGRYPDVQPEQRRAPLAIVFTSPQIATVGLGLDQIKARCPRGYGVGSVSFENQGRSRVLGKNKGELRVYGEYGTDLFLGAEMFGPAAEHVGHLLAWAVQSRMTVTRMLEMPFYHPVIEEGVRTALRDLNHNLDEGPEITDSCMECGPGA
ncbi:MAG: dihydrolipoyl dehydrogenase [Alteromonadaceae bacterium]|nr:dihydrolipoyl dehydrogenase [Alteromonadaceae bacterium]